MARTKTNTQNNTRPKLIIIRIKHVWVLTVPCRVKQFINSNESDNTLYVYSVLKFNESFALLLSTGILSDIISGRAIILRLCGFLEQPKGYILDAFKLSIFL